jgi:hypothetical protein
MLSIHPRMSSQDTVAIQLAVHARPGPEGQPSLLKLYSCA